MAEQKEHNNLGTSIDSGAIFRKDTTAQASFAKIPAQTGENISCSSHQHTFEFSN